MSNEEAVKVLAEREGGTPCQCGNPNCFRHPSGDQKFLVDLGYYKPHALSPVLAKLTDEEWSTLYHGMALIQYATSPVNPLSHDRYLCGYMKMILTLPPEQLVHAVAEAIVACRGGDK
jgi:hypothetical protein